MNCDLFIANTVDAIRGIVLGTNEKCDTTKNTSHTDTVVVVVVVDSLS